MMFIVFTIPKYFYIIFYYHHYHYVLIFKWKRSIIIQFSLNLFETIAQVLKLISFNFIICSQIIPLYNLKGDLVYLALV